MPSAAFLRVAARGVARAGVARPTVARPFVARTAAVNFSTSIPRRSEHAEETFEEFTSR
jgi:cytochrome c oxidase subunit 5a